MGYLPTTFLASDPPTTTAAMTSSSSPLRQDPPTEKDVRNAIERTTVSATRIEIVLNELVVAEGQDRVLTLPWTRSSWCRRREIIQGVGEAQQPLRAMRTKSIARRSPLARRTPIQPHPDHRVARLRRLRATPRGFHHVPPPGMAKRGTRARRDNTALDFMRPWPSAAAPICRPAPNDQRGPWRRSPKMISSPL